MCTAIERTLGLVVKALSSEKRFKPALRLFQKGMKKEWDALTKGLAFCSVSRQASLQRSFQYPVRCLVQYTWYSLLKYSVTAVATGQWVCQENKSAKDVPSFKCCVAITDSPLCQARHTTLGSPVWKTRPHNSSMLSVHRAIVHLNAKMSKDLWPKG